MTIILIIAISALFCVVGWLLHIYAVRRACYLVKLELGYLPEPPAGKNRTAAVHRVTVLPEPEKIVAKATAGASSNP